MDKIDSQWKSLPGSDDIAISTLKNGVRLITRSNFNSPSIALLGMLPAGSLFDTVDRCGQAHYVSRALMLGTRQQSMAEIYDELESAGAALGLAAGLHDVTIHGHALAEDLPLMLKHISQALIEPTFPEDQIEKLRAKLLTAIAIREDDTNQMASLVFDEMLFPGHPFGLPTTGYKESIAAITRQEIIDFHQRHYAPEGLVIVVVGAIEHEQVATKAEATFGSWLAIGSAEQKIIPPLQPVTETIRRHIPLREKSQTDLVMGCVGPARNSDDFVPASLGNNILGVFGMMGRIGASVRERSGLAYYAGSRVQSWQSAGTWEVSAGVNPENLNRAVDLIRQELERFIRQNVDEGELADSKANMIGQLPLALESNAGIANALMNIQKYGLPLDYYRQYPAMLEAITAEQIRAIAQKYLHPDKLVISSAG